jgi:two-component system chemotaxis response regulator CheY
MDEIAIKDLSVAVVEPSVMQGRIIITHLDELHIEKIQYYARGNDALEGLRRFPPDLVISAMYLPDMDATELVQTIRNDPALESVPFMLISSETSLDSLEPIRQAGVVAILPKPFAVSDFTKAVHATLEYIRVDTTSEQELEFETMRVLVVDDSPLARKHIARVLKNIGISNIDTAENGDEAVKLIEACFYDLIITDYNMPEMDGQQLTRYIRDSSSQAGVPVLMVTSEADENRLTAVRQAGISGMVDKPFDPATVKKLIRNLIGS